MLPALQKEETTWPELRSMGVGWWLRSTNKLRRCIEKVRRLNAAVISLGVRTSHSGLVPVGLNALHSLKLKFFTWRN